MSNPLNDAWLVPGITRTKTAPALVNYMGRRRADRSHPGHHEDCAVADEKVDGILSGSSASSVSQNADPG